jgi:hypothetical protein
VRVTRVETEEACDDWVRRHVIAPGIHSQKVSTCSKFTKAMTF